MREEIELKSEAVNELLTAVPKWIVRWGISVIFLIILLILTLSFFVKYSDKLSAKTTITTTNPPVTLVAKTNGKITALRVKNNQLVRKGDVLMVVENSANDQDVNAVFDLLEQLQAQLKTEKLPEIKLDSTWQMGDLTGVFLSFLKSYKDYQLQLEISPQEKEIAIIDKELAEYQLLQGKYQSQEQSYRQELILVEKDYKRYHTLFHNGSISAKEHEDKQREYLSTKRAYENVKIANINNKLAINNLQKSKLQLQNQACQENKRYEQALNQSMQILKSQIEIWAQTYLIKAPIDGTASLFNYWSIHQHIKQGDAVLSIVPTQKQRVIAKLLLPIHHSGKLKFGQVVNIKLDNYPYQEYGTLSGYVKNICKIPQNETYSIEVSLPNKLTTSHHKQLEYKEEMQGTADIITEELSVFERIFYQLRKILKK